jgi:hypothetical protein
MEIPRSYNFLFLDTLSRPQHYIKILPVLQSAIHSDLAEFESLDSFTCVSFDSFNLQFQIPDLLTGFTEFSCKTSIFPSEAC